MSDGRRRLVNNPVQRVNDGVAGERLSTSGSLIEEAAEREDVGALVDRFRLRLFGRHVADRAHHDAGS